MNNHRLLTGLLAVVLSGCGVCARGDDPRSVSLEDLFLLAENNSMQLRPFFSAEEEALCAIDIARSSRLPDINASLSLSYLGDGFTTKRNLSDYQKAPIPHFGNGVSLGVSQPVYAGGAITNSIDLAGLKLKASRYATDRQRNIIRFRLTGLYLDIYKYCNLRTVIESNISQARKVLAEMQARYQQGMALQNDITRYELLVSNLELDHLKINNTLDILNRDLAVTVGLDARTVIRPDSTILARSLPKESEEWWQNEAGLNAPSLKLARSGVEISRKTENVVRSGSRPKIGLQAGWTIDGPILVDVPPINRNLSYWYIGVGVSYNLSSLYKNNRSIARSKVATLHAREQLDAENENISLIIHDDYVRYLEAYEELKTRQKSVELAESNYQTTATRYSADMALLTDMLDAANSKLDAERQLVNARINIIYYYYRLLFTSGKI